MTIHLLRPLAMSLGIKGGKIMRFVERKSGLEWHLMLICRGLRRLLLWHSGSYRNRECPRASIAK